MDKLKNIQWIRLIFLMLVAGFVLMPMIATLFGGFKS